MNIEGGREGTPWVRPLARYPKNARARAGKILIICSDWAWVLPAERFSAVLRDAVIPVCDEAGNVVETHQQAGDFKEC